jgi:DNA-binding FrmR family transcriptional regulator
MSHHHPPEYYRTIKSRLHRIVGQLNGLERMIDANRDCPEILMQIVSARKALKSLGDKVISEHFRHCIEGAQSPAEANQKMAELLTVLERYVD